MAFPTKLLNNGEEIILDLRPHWWRIFPASAALAVAIIVGIVAWANGNDAFQILGGILVLAALVWFVQNYIKWPPGHGVHPEGRRRGHGAPGGRSPR